MAQGEGADAVKFRQQTFMSEFAEHGIELQQNGRKNGQNGKYTENDTFCHDDTKIQTDGQRHKAQGHETEYRCHGRAEQGNERGLDGSLHGTCFVFGGLYLFFFKTVNEEDGIVHCYTQLQNSGDTLGNKRDFSHKKVGAHVVNNRTGKCKEQCKGHEKRFH